MIEWESLINYEEKSDIKKIHHSYQFIKKTNKPKNREFIESR